MSSYDDKHVPREVVKAAASLYQDFEQAWGLVVAGTKESWCEIWAWHLAEYSTQTIQHAAGEFQGQYTKLLFSAEPAEIY